MENISIEEEEEERKVKLNLLSVIYDFEEKKKPFLSSFFSCFDYISIDYFPFVPPLRAYPDRSLKTK